MAYQPNPITVNDTVKQIMDRVNDMMDPLEVANTVAIPIISETEPTTGLMDGVLWYNPTTKIVKIYLKGAFTSLGSGDEQGGQLSEPPSYEKYEKRVTVSTDTNTIEIGITGYNRAEDMLWVYQNSTFIAHGGDYTFTEDGLSIKKVDGVWEAGTVIDLVALVLVPGSSVNPTMASIETFYTITQDGESEITIPIPEYSYLTDRLHLYHDNLFLYEGDQWSLNEDGTKVILNYSVIAGDKLLFTVLKKVKEPVSNGADGSTLAPNSVADSKLAPDNKVGSLSTLKTANKESAVKAINEVYDSLQTNIGNVSTNTEDINKLKSRADENEGQLSNIKFSLGEMDSTVQGLQTNDQEYESRISNLENVTNREGVILKAPDQSTWKLTVDNTGALVTTKTVISGEYDGVVIVESPDGSGWQVGVTNDGTLVTTKIQ
ncbi:gp18.2 [Bacillus phage SPO1]|uniref:Gp18.2 n=1 Tax=Bacillus phage SP01 TaxID=2884427 RepID=B6V2T1_BPSP1|nr:gp18.2 [Bacillus phage SPO1]ACI91002.1 gp18.2 [Bacillus phage SPO1]